MKASQFLVAVFLALAGITLYTYIAEQKNLVHVAKWTEERAEPAPRVAKPPVFKKRVISKEFGSSNSFFIEFTNDNFDEDVQTIGFAMDFAGYEYSERWFRSFEEARGFAKRLKSYDACMKHNAEAIKLSQKMSEGFEVE